MTEVAILIVCCYVFFKAGEWFGYFKYTKLLVDSGVDVGRMIDDLEKKEEKKSDIAKLHVEVEKGVLYLYEHETNDFVCQGNTLEELVSLAKKHKNINKAVVAHEEKVFLFNDGEVKEIPAK
jgi:hypothetical protein